MKCFFYIVTAFYLLFAINVQAQYNSPQNSAWRFGGNAGYNFTNNTAVGSQLNASECAASVADASGNLLFYTDGNMVWDRNNNPMPDGNPVFPASFNMNTQSTVQGALIVPFPNDANKYYLFSLSAQETPQNAGGRLYYSVVDMSLNSGLGNVVAVNAHSLIDTGFSEHMIAVPTCGGVWLVLHDRVSPIFKAYKIDNNGLSATPVSSTTGVQGFVGPGNSSNPTFLGNNFYITGQMAVSPDHKQLAAAYFRGNLVELYNFDNNTGSITAKGVVDSVNDAYGFYGVSFSPDGQKLYAANCAANIALKAFNQYNLALPTMPQIRASKVFLGPCNALLTQMQLGPDGKIYFNGNYISKMGAINNPNALGLASGLNPQAVNLLSNTNVRGALPNTVMKALEMTGDTFKMAWKDTLVCPGATFSMAARSGGTNYIWSNGQMGTLAQISTDGVYWVSYVKNCALYIDTLKVRVKAGGVSLGNDTAVCNYFQLFPQFEGVPTSMQWHDGSSASSYLVYYPQPVAIEAVISGCVYNDSINVDIVSLYADLGNDTTICRGELMDLPLTVTNIPNNTSLLWNNGSTQASIVVREPGMYAVTLSHPECGNFTDEITIAEMVCDCDFGVPTAFTPNGDGKNDVFGIITASDCPIRGYVLRIFNRWGQMVFESFDADKKWNGMFNGAPADIGVYYYHLQFEKGTNAKMISSKGDVSLLR